MGALRQLGEGLLTEFGERLGHKVFGEVIPEVAQPMFRETGGFSKVDANIYSKAIDFDPEVRQPLEELIMSASKGNDDAYPILEAMARDFEIEDSAIRTRNKAQKNFDKQQGIVQQRNEADILIKDLEDKKIAWQSKYQTGETGKAQPPTIEGARAGESIEVPLASGNRDEMMADLQEYIRLNESIGKLTNNKGLLRQPKKGWQKIFGNVLDEKGFPMRLDGGRETSRGPFKFTSSADNIRRNWKENIYIPDENPQRKTKARKDAKKANIKVEKHHVIGIEQTSPWGFLNDGTPRAKEDVAIIEGIVKRETGLDLGNKDLNEIYPSDAGHMGKKGDPISSAFGVHRLLDNMTDFQGFKNWQTEATKIKFTMPLRKGQKKPSVKWFNNNQGILSDTKTGKEIGTIDEFKKLYPGAEATNFKVQGPGTYNITKGIAQKHGFSNELLATISRIEDPELAAETLVMFLKDSGAAETMEAAAALAFRVVDHGITADEMTKAFSRKHSQQMIDLAKQLLNGDDPLYKNNPILQGVIRAEESAQALTKKLGI